MKPKVYFYCVHIFFNDLVSKLATNFAKEVWFSDSLYLFYFSNNNLQWRSIEFGSNF